MIADVRSILLKITRQELLLLQRVSEWQNVTPFNVLFTLKTKLVLASWSWQKSQTRDKFDYYLPWYSCLSGRAPHGEYTRCTVDKNTLEKIYLTQYVGEGKVSGTSNF